MGLVKPQDQKPSLRDKVGLGLFMGLRPMREHTITYRDACSLSSLREMGFLDISRARVSLINRTLWRNPNLKSFLAHISQESVLECERVFLKKNNPFFIRFECQILGFLAPLFGFSLASTRGGNRAGRANSEPGQNRAGPKLARFFRATILTAQPALKIGPVGPNCIFKAKKKSGGPGRAIPGWAILGRAKFGPVFFGPKI